MERWLMRLKNVSERLHSTTPSAGGFFINPGAFLVGFPPVGSFFIGVFGGPINTIDPDVSVYLWETSNETGRVFKFGRGHNFGHNYRFPTKKGLTITG
jgi:hypothetical protein